MVFASLVFIYLFLPLNILLYFVSKNITYRNIVLIVFSLFFYAWGEPVWVLLLILSATLDYFNGRTIEKLRGTRLSKLPLIFSIVVNLGLLITFKYSGFIVSNINTVFGILIPVPEFKLPIGISFYTFQTLSYVLDVYRGKVEAAKKYHNYLLYLSMYPQLIAGPIVRYTDVAAEIKQRKSTLSGIYYGAARFCVGLGKKVLIANMAGKLASGYMKGDIASLPVTAAWFGAFMYMMQIYFDFSGYSDMAIGLGRIFGFKYPENFNYPYISKSITEFWRRWHISLSSFFRDYVYIPLGGKYRHQYLNLAIVWLLTGLWHGASWNFIAWGAYYGVFIILEKLFLLKVGEKLPSFIRLIGTLVVVIFGWVLFYFTDISEAWQYVLVMLGSSGVFHTSTFGAVLMNNIFFILVSCICCVPVLPRIHSFLEKKSPVLASCLTTTGSIILFIASAASLVGESYNPFLYFRF
ncbi:MAG: MBOAT family protein [Clostridiales bacterium]|nr:MBOAT family protein [Clostridiales bacterium]